MTQLSLLCPARLVPQRHDAQALLLSAWQGILQEFLGKILALQVEVATLHGAACCLDLICPDLWRTLRHFPRPLDIAGLGRQFDSVCWCNFVTMVYVLRGFGTGHVIAAYHILGTWCVMSRLWTNSHGVPTPLWPPQAYALFGPIV
jgi:hypothetical protein